MTREEFVAEVRVKIAEILSQGEDEIAGLVDLAYGYGYDDSELDSCRRGAEAMKAAVDTILDVMSYDAKALFNVNNETMAAKLISDMSANEVFEAKTRIDEWVKKQIGDYRVGLVVRDPLRNACVITKIYTGRTAGVMGGFHVLYADGSTNRWPVGTEFEALEDDGGTLSDLSEAISLADEEDRNA